MDSAQFVLPLHSCSLALALWRQGAKRCAPAASALARSCVPGPFAGPWQRARGTVTWPALCSFAAHRPRARCPEPQARCKDHARPLGCVFSPQEGVACLWKGVAAHAPQASKPHRPQAICEKQNNKQKNRPAGRWYRPLCRPTCGRAGCGMVSVPAHGPRLRPPCRQCAAPHHVAIEKRAADAVPACAQGQKGIQVQGLGAPAQTAVWPPGPVVPSSARHCPAVRLRRRDVLRAGRSWA